MSQPFDNRDYDVRDLAKDRIKHLEEALQRQDNVIIEKDAEIERLKALITELADVLESYGFDELLDLIRRAREAAQ